MRAVIAALCLLGLSAPTLSAPLAQTNAWTKLNRQISYKYGRCVVLHHAGGASKAVLRNLDAQNIAARYPRLLDNDCLSNLTIAFKGDALIYVLADGLVTRELADAPVPNLVHVQSLTHRQPPPPPPAPPPGASDADAVGYQTALARIDQIRSDYLLSLFGECVVRANTAGAKGLLMSEPETTDEDARFQVLQATFEACMPEDKTVTLTKQALRGAIALNYYRLAKAALQTPR